MIRCIVNLFCGEVVGTVENIYRHKLYSYT